MMDLSVLLLCTAASGLGAPVAPSELQAQIRAEKALARSSMESYLRDHAARSPFGKPPPGGLTRDGPSDQEIVRSVIAAASRGREAMRAYDTQSPAPPFPFRLWVEVPWGEASKKVLLLGWRARRDEASRAALRRLNNSLVEMRVLGTSEDRPGLEDNGLGGALMRAFAFCCVPAEPKMFERAMVTAWEDPAVPLMERVAFNWQVQNLILVEGWDRYQVLLDSESPRVRGVTLAMVKPWASDAVFRKVVRMMGDQDPRVAQSARIMMGRAKWISALPALFDALSDPAIPGAFRPWLLEGLEYKGFVAREESGRWKLYRRPGGRKKSAGEIRYEQGTRDRRARKKRAAGATPASMGQ